MEVVLALPLLIVPFIIPFITGLMAKTYGRKFWLWFFLGLLLPFIACAILLCLPDRSVKRQTLKPVDNEKIFDHLFIENKKQQTIEHGTHLSATA